MEKGGPTVMRKFAALGIPLVILAICACGSLARASGRPAQQEPRKKPLQPEAIEKTQESEATPATDVKEETGPIAVFADIEAGWKSEQAQRILCHYGKGKVAISIEGSGPTGGQFSRNQSYYLFQDLFKFTITEEFQFVQYRHVSDGRGNVYAVAERRYKRNDDGRIFKDKIYVSLRSEDDRWVINEIKSIR
jgi:hypothetical protein